MHTTATAVVAQEYAADELGCISLYKEGNEILFVFSNRNDRGSIIIITNLMFDMWQEVLMDPILTDALVDHLVHRAHVLYMSDYSNRIRDMKEWLV